MPILHGFLMQRRDGTGRCEFKARCTLQVFFVCFLLFVFFLLFVLSPLLLRLPNLGLMSLQVE